MSETHLTARSSPYKFLIPFAHELRPLLGRACGVNVKRLGDRFDPQTPVVLALEERPALWLFEVRLRQLDRLGSEH